MDAITELRGEATALGALAASKAADIERLSARLHSPARQRAEEQMRAGANRIVGLRVEDRHNDIQRQADHYVREKHLPDALPKITEAEIADQSAAGTRRIVERLKRRLASVRPGWAHEHIDTFAIRAAILAEERRLDAMTGGVS